MPEAKEPSQAPDNMDEKSGQDIQPENPIALDSDSQQGMETNPSSQEFVSQTEENLDHEHLQDSSNLEFILDIPLELSVELGRTRIRIADILKLGQGAIIELTNPAGNSLEILINKKPIARGEVVVVNEKYGIRLIEILSVMERIEKLK